MLWSKSSSFLLCPENVEHFCFDKRHVLDPPHITSLQRMGTQWGKIQIVVQKLYTDSQNELNQLKIRISDMNYTEIPILKMTAIFCFQLLLSDSCFGCTTADLSLYTHYWVVILTLVYTLCLPKCTLLLIVSVVDGFAISTLSRVLTLQYCPQNVVKNHELNKGPCLLFRCPL